MNYGLRPLLLGGIAKLVLLPEDPTGLHWLSIGHYFAGVCGQFSVNLITRADYHVKVRYR